MARLGRAFPAVASIRSQLAPAPGGRSGDASIAFGALTLSAGGIATISGDANVTLSAAAVATAGTVALSGTAAIALDPVISVAVGVVAVSGGAAIALGAVRLSSINSSAVRWAKRRLGVGISIHGH